MDPKGDLFDEKPGPNLGDQLPLADYFTRMLDQNEQEVRKVPDADFEPAVVAFP
jgi:hypothetical protein